MDSETVPAPSTLKLTAVLFGTACLLGLTYVYGLLFLNTSEYFSFPDLATASTRDIHLFGAIARLALPVLVGFGLSQFSNGLPLLESTLSGFLASLLLSWPAIYFPTLRQYLVNENLAVQPVKLLIVYGLFIFSYSVLARIGAVGGLYYLSKKKTQTGVVSTAKKVSVPDIVWTVVIGLLTNAIWEIVVRLWK